MIRCLLRLVVRVASCDSRGGLRNMAVSLLGHHEVATPRPQASTIVCHASALDSIQPKLHCVGRFKHGHQVFPSKTRTVPLFHGRMKCMHIDVTDTLMTQRLTEHRDKQGLVIVDGQVPMNVS